MKMSMVSKVRCMAARVVFAGCSLLLTACASGPSLHGVSDGRLIACPSSPNCVSTLEINSHGVSAFTLAVAPERAVAAIAAELSKMDRVEIVEQKETYLRAEFTSAVFRFVDDVEFHVLKNGNVAVRSASRVGYSDLGANRKRVEELRQIFRAHSIIR